MACRGKRSAGNLIASVFGCLTLAVPRGAAAEPPPLDLTWTAPASCPAGKEVSLRVASLLGSSPENPKSRLTAVGVVVESAQGFALDLSLESGGVTSRRKLRGADCATLADAAAIVLAVAIDPRALDREPVTPPAPDPPPDPKPVDPPKPSPLPAPFVPPPAPASPRPTILPRVPSAQSESLYAALGGSIRTLVDIGSLPGATPALELALELWLDAYRIEAAFLILPDATAEAENRPTKGARFSFLGGVLDGCRSLVPWAVRRERASLDLTFSACVGLEAGAMNGDGFGVALPEEASAFWIAPRASLPLRLELVPPLGLRLQPELIVPLDPRSFVLRLDVANTVVHRPTPVAGRFGGAIDFVF